MKITKTVNPDYKHGQGMMWAVYKPLWEWFTPRHG